MNQHIRKLVTNGFEVSRKILCLILACTLLIQTGCQTTKVLKSIEQEELMEEKYKPLNLKAGQAVRITYLDSSSKKPKRLTGRVKSVTADAIVIVTYIPGFKDKDVSISFEQIKSIELIKEKRIFEYVIVPIFIISLCAIIIIKRSFGEEYD